MEARKRTWSELAGGLELLGRYGEWDCEVAAWLDLLCSPAPRTLSTSPGRRPDSGEVSEMEGDDDNFVDCEEGD